MSASFSFFDALSPITLIEASAGTGKTYTLERLALRFLAEGVPLDALLAVTFTRAATEELSERVRALIAKTLKDNALEIDGRTLALHEAFPGSDERAIRARLTAALRDYDGANIFTIHSFCERALSEYPFQSGFMFNPTIEEIDESAEEAARDFFRLHARDIPYLPYKAMCDALIEENDFDCVINAIVARYIRHIAPKDGRILLPAPARTAEAFEWYMKEREAFLARKGERYKTYQALTARMSSLETLNDELSERTFKKDLYKPEVKNSALDACVTLKNAHTLDEALAGAEALKAIGYTNAKLFERKQKRERAVEELQSFDFMKAIDETAAPYTLREIGFALLYRAFDAIDAKRAERSAITGGVTFPDVIAALHRALKTSPPLVDALRARYTVALIDEFQDTDRLQWELFRAIFDAEGHRMILVGDPKQAIYGFRGADIGEYIKTKRALSLRNENALRALKDNYRSSKKVVDAVNALFQSVFVDTDGAFAYEPLVAKGASSAPQLLRNGKDDGKVELIPCPEEIKAIEAFRAHLFDCVVLSIEELLSPKSDARIVKEGVPRPVCPSDIAILLERNKDVDLLARTLNEKGIAAVASKDRSVFDTEEARAALLLLETLLAPYNESLMKRTLTDIFFDCSYADLARIESEGALPRVMRMANDVSVRITEEGAYQALTALFSRSFPEFYIAESFFDRNARRINGERRVTNVMHLLEILNESELRLRGNLPALLAEFRMRIENAKERPDEHLIRLDKDTRAVSVMTMHGAKGLEFPIVYIAGGVTSPRLSRHLESHDYHDKETGTRAVDFFKEHEREYQDAFYEERMRLLYVAFTRAKTKLFAPFASPEHKFKNSAPALLELYGRVAKGAGIEDGALFEYLTETLSDTFMPFVPRVPNARGEEREKERVELIAPQTFARDIFLKRRAETASYSSLVRRARLDSDEREDDGSIVARRGKDAAFSRYTIAGGAALGNAVHMIFETLDFARIPNAFEAFCKDAEAKRIVRAEAERLCAYNDVPLETIERVLMEMTYDALTRELYTPNAKPIILKDIPIDKQKRELEFLIPVKKGVVAWEDEEARFSAKVNEGFLRGFIDMLFEHDGRYYILDWKSNRLGEDERAYTGATLKETMNAHFYTVQYALYCAALVKIIGNTFSYEKDFGGAFYFYVRSAKDGVYFAKPEKERIEQFASGFLKESL